MRGTNRKWRSNRQAQGARPTSSSPLRSRAARPPVIECDVTGLLAWRGGQPGQVGNEAATAVFHQCRGSGSSPSPFSVVLLVRRSPRSSFSSFVVLLVVSHALPVPERLRVKPARRIVVPARIVCAPHRC